MLMYLLQEVGDDFSQPDARPWWGGWWFWLVVALVLVAVIGLGSWRPRRRPTSRG